MRNNKPWTNKSLFKRHLYLVSQGGLGNQLFIWNAAHSLINSGVKGIKIVHISGDRTHSETQFQLSKLESSCCHDLSVVSSKLLKYIIKALLQFQNKVNKIVNRHIIKDFGVDDVPTLFKIKGAFLIHGFFQDWKYVMANYASWINELESAASYYFNLAKKDFNGKLESPFQGVHIRRGDYVKNANTLGLLKLSYYTNLLEDDLKVYLASDDETISAELISISKLKHNIIIGSSDTWLCFATLAYSRRLVIANSTFSWWAGIVCNRRGGVVIAPNKWNKNMTQNDVFMQWPGFEKARSIFE